MEPDSCETVNMRRALKVLVFIAKRKNPRMYINVSKYDHGCMSI